MGETVVLLGGADAGRLGSLMETGTGKAKFWYSASIPKRNTRKRGSGGGDAQAAPWLGRLGRLGRGCLLMGLAVLLGSGCQIHDRARPTGEGSGPRLSAGAPTSGGVSGEARARLGGWEDLDEDGLPDVAELRTHGDRENFRRWMTGIAEWQFYRINDLWSDEQRDCAGLVRFAWREALRRHDRRWFQAMTRGGADGPDVEMLAPDVRAYTLDRSPLGEKLFRFDYGRFEPGDLAAGRFSDFADARTLKNHNTRRVGREVRVALPGDLLFFHQPWVQTYSYHVMLFLGKARHEGNGAEDWVVYHTGGALGGRGSRGEMRKVRVSTLREHPDPRWHPTEANRHFLGYYRLRILE